MPFCRKCGRRLVEYSESCPDCGTSTTAPLIKIKRPQSSSQLLVGGEAKPARVFIPEVSSIQIKVATIKPPKIVAANKKDTPVKDAPPKATVEVRAFVPATPTKPAEPPKPVLSAKHIVKPKKGKATKAVAAFTIANARPIAGLQAPLSRPAAAKPPIQTQPVVQAKSVPKPEPASPIASLAQPILVAQPEPIVAPIKPVTPPTITAQPKPMFSSVKHVAPKPITPAPVYPPHEIIKSNVSLKEDMLANPQDYETEIFPFDLECPLEHFWPEGSALPVSKGRAYCPKCGERLSKPKPKKKRRYRYRRL
jgi:rRNA maturation protein Nop10